MQHVSKTILLALALTGCASVARGLDLVQAGLAQADMATDKAAEGFLEAVTKVQQACDQTPDPAACMDRLGLGPDVLDAVCVPGGDGEAACIAGAAADLEAAYSQGVTATAQAAEAWGELEPHLKAAQEAAKAVDSGLAR